MFRVTALASAFAAAVLLVAGCSQAAEPTDSIMGEYVGTFTPAGGAPVKAEARVIAYEHGKYRVVLLQGQRTKPAAATILLNGVKIQDEQAIEGTTGGASGKEGEPGALRLQDHHNPMRFRNIWIVELKDEK